MVDLLTAGATILGGVLGGYGAKKGGESAAAAQRYAVDLQRDMYEQQRKDFAPYREAGTTALDALMQMVGLGGNFSGAGQQQEGPSVIQNDEPSTSYGTYEFLTSQGVPDWKARGVTGMQTNRFPNSISPGSLYGVREDINPMVFRAYGGPVAEGQTFVGGEVGPEPVYNSQGDLVDVVGMNGPEINTANEDVFVEPNPATAPATAAPAADAAAGGGGFNLPTDPGYQFRVLEGQRALEQSRAAQGGLLSGATGRALAQYGQQQGSNEFQNIYNRIANIAGLGQVGAQGSANAAMNFGMMGGQGLANIGSIQGASQMGQYGALGQSLGNLGFLYGMQQQQGGGG